MLPNVSAHSPGTLRGRRVMLRRRKTDPLRPTFYHFAPLYVWLPRRSIHLCLLNNHLARKKQQKLKPNKNRYLADIAKVRSEELPECSSVGVRAFATAWGRLHVGLPTGPSTRSGEDQDHPRRGAVACAPACRLVPQRAEPATPGLRRRFAPSRMQLHARGIADGATQRAIPPCTDAAVLKALPTLDRSVGVRCGVDGTKSHSAPVPSSAGRRRARFCGNRRC